MANEGYHEPIEELSDETRDMHRAIISVLCGHVFPRPAFALRWRLRLFEILMRVQPLVPLVPRRPEFSLFEHAAAAAADASGPVAGLQAANSTFE